MDVFDALANALAIATIASMVWITKPPVVPSLGYVLLKLGVCSAAWAGFFLLLLRVVSLPGTPILTGIMGVGALILSQPGRSAHLKA